MNILRTLDAVTGTLLNSRILQQPFLQSDIGCTDIPDYIGVIVCLIPFFDGGFLTDFRRVRQSLIPAPIQHTSFLKVTRMEHPTVASRMVSLNTQLADLFADQYLGIYKFFAVDVQTLKDRPGFPVLVDGSSADNDRARWVV